jgi:hypothetical protein
MIKLKEEALLLRVEQIKQRGKVFTNQDIYTWVQWEYGKGRSWADKYILPALKWRPLKGKQYPYPEIGKYLPLDELKSSLKSLLNDY